MSNSRRQPRAERDPKPMVSFDGSMRSRGAHLMRLTQSARLVVLRPSTIPGITGRNVGSVQVAAWLSALDRPLPCRYCDSVTVYDWLSAVVVGCAYIERPAARLPAIWFSVCWGCDTGEDYHLLTLMGEDVFGKAGFARLISSHGQVTQTW